MEWLIELPETLQGAVFIIASGVSIFFVLWGIKMVMK